MLDGRVLGRVFAARLVVSACALLAFGVVSLRIDAQAAPQSPGATTTPAPAGIRFELASIRRNLEAEQQRAAVPIYVPVIPGRAQTLPKGVLRARGMSVRELIGDAHGYRNRAHSEIGMRRTGSTRSATTSRQGPITSSRSHRHGPAAGG